MHAHHLGASLVPSGVISGLKLTVERHQIITPKIPRAVCFYHSQEMKQNVKSRSEAGRRVLGSYRGGPHAPRRFASWNPRGWAPFHGLQETGPWNKPAVMLDSIPLREIWENAPASDVIFFARGQVAMAILVP